MDISLFQLGTIEISPNAATVLQQSGLDHNAFLARHAGGDWGDIDERQRSRNAEALDHNRSLQSRFVLDDDSADDSALVLTTNPYWSVTRIFLEREFAFQEVSVQEGYALWSNVYDKQKNPLIAVEAPAVAEILNTLNVKAALDAATGTGRHALNLARRGVDVTAVDQSVEMLEIAKRTAEAEGFNIRFETASIEGELPLPTESFDLVICALALSHLPDLDPAFQTFHRLLRPGGTLLITDFHPEIIAFGWETGFHTPGTKYTLPTMNHTRQTYLDCAMQTGFTLRSVLDLPVKMVPEGYLFPEHVEEAGEQNLCLILLAQKSCPRYHKN